MRGLRLGILVSGGGTNLQSILEAIKSKELTSKVVCVISNKEKAFGLERARRYNVPAIFINPNEANYDSKLLETLKAYNVDMVVLAGYLKIVDPSLVEVYKGKVINIHPSLLPKFGGKGYYGIHVHEAVIKAGETESGATVHYVDQGIDTGEIILQKKLRVTKEDTAESLQKRILEQIEHVILVEAIKFLEGGTK